jgi:serine/threonine-protein kinase HipA
MAAPDPLGVWLHGVHVADLIPRKPWDLRCRYTSAAVDAWPGNIPLLSCSLPLRARSLDARVFCDGLLPEGQHRPAMAALARVAANDTHSLLARFGRDVAGALVIATTEPETRRGRVVPLDDTQLADEVLALPNHPLGLHDDSELSIAGLQDKLLLVDIGGGRWGRPIYGMPSTHILKVEDRRYPGLAAAEVACLQLALAVGMTSVEARLVTIAETPCLIVSRFDRVVGTDGTIDRVHQEDVSQALARDPDLDNRRGKYEQYGGPTLAEVASLLDRYADDPTTELDRLVAATTFNVLIGNADAHGKNIALTHPTAATVALAPLYDTVPTVLWPQLRARAAMSINGRWQLGDITAADVANEAARWRHDPTRALRIAAETAARVRDALDAGVIDPDSPVASVTGERTRTFLATT